MVELLFAFAFFVQPSKHDQPPACEAVATEATVANFTPVADDAAHPVASSAKARDASQVRQPAANGSTRRGLLHRLFRQ